MASENDNTLRGRPLELSIDFDKTDSVFTDVGFGQKFIRFH
jgi:hypothetical protein